MSLNRAEASLENTERLLAALGGSPDGWEYTGRVEAQDPRTGVSCACGHRPIKWVYHWQHKDGRTLVTGSTCVERVPGIDEQSVDRIRLHVRSLKAALREKDRARRQVEQQARVEQVYAETIAMIDARLAEIDQIEKFEFTNWAVNKKWALECAMKRKSALGSKLIYLLNQKRWAMDNIDKDRRQP